ncbi:putative DNA-binding transcriptional regulator AlpA [Paraburkholderia sp. GAS33]|jgi:predicted DNA-binding transcriptional regulator AlpA|uniref:helix-turn-helix transcriptional regulator n=1 Tax=Paraburkholderia sp. GAS33 TaxID=3035130 RepID=UPI003D217D5C
MNRNIFSAPSRDVQANEPPSVITRIRHARHILPARAGNGVKDKHLPANSDSGSTKAISVKPDASTVYSPDTPLLGQLIGWVHSRTSDRYMKEPEVLTIIGRSKAAMRKDVSLGLFPAQVRTGLKSTGWRESEVMGWVEATTILSRVANPGFDMKEFVAALMASRIPL